MGMVIRVACGSWPAVRAGAAVALIVATSCLPALTSIQPRAADARDRLVVIAPSDVDGDGLADAMEDSLARQFSPVFFFAAEEPNFPAPVESILVHSELRWVDRRCGLDSLLKRAPTIGDLAQRVEKSCGDTASFDSRAHRDRGRRTTFYLRTVAKEFRRGMQDRALWVTYAHVYPNDRCVADRCGVTIQYWLAFPFNSGSVFGWGIGPGDHGGDWESGHVVLGPFGEPQWVRFLGHRSIDSVQWNGLERQRGHPVIYVGKGGHTFRPHGERALPGFVAGIDGPLRNLGERTAPRAGSEFVQFAGLWGSPARFNAGYWGPAFNETSEGRRNFISAWCLDAREPYRYIAVSPAVFIYECFGSAP